MALLLLFLFLVACSPTAKEDHDIESAIAFAAAVRQQSRNPDSCYQRPDKSIMEITRFTLGFFTFDDRGVAELFGLEFARLVADTSSPELVAGQRVIERETQNRLIDVNRNTWA